MDASRLLRRLRDAGFRVKANGEALMVAPGDRLTPSLRARIETSKAGLLVQVGDGPSSDPVRCIDCGTYLPLSGVRCPDCRDAVEEPTCASCGARIDRPDLSVCDVCSLEAGSAPEPKEVSEPNRP